MLDDFDGSVNQLMLLLKGRHDDVIKSSNHTTHTFDLFSNAQNDNNPAPTLSKIEQKHTQQNESNIQYKTVLSPDQVSAHSNFQVENHQRRIKPPLPSFPTSRKKSPLGARYLTKQKKNVFNNKYVSPFILIAEQRAKARAKEVLRYSKVSKPVSHEWNGDTSAPVLFDPHLKKQEIFRLQPRKPPELYRKEFKNERHESDDDLGSAGDELKQRKVTPLTIRTFGVCILLIRIVINVSNSFLFSY